MPLETGDDYYNYYSSMMPWGNQGTGTTAPGTGITQLATPTIKYPPQGGGDFKGGGIWGNLDLSKSKTFNKDIWTGEIGGPANMYGGWNTQDVQGFYNPQLGQYQTLAGKNINHLGLTVPSIAGMLFDKDFGKGPRIGDIKGTFTEGIPEEGIWAALTGKKKQQKVEDQLIMNQEIENRRIRKEAAERAAAANRIKPQHHGDISQGGGHQAPNIRSISDEGPGVTASSGMHGGKHYARGGILGAF